MKRILFLYDIAGPRNSRFVEEGLKQPNWEFHHTNSSGFVMTCNINPNFLDQFDLIINFQNSPATHNLLRSFKGRIVNHPDCSAISSDKYLTYITVEESKLIEQPRTSLSYEGFTYPYVIKNRRGFMGRQVYMARNDRERDNIMARCKYPMFQEYYGYRYGEDLRLMLYNHKVVVAEKRKNMKDFRANVVQGAVATVVDVKDIDPIAIEKAEAISRLVGLEFCSVDLLYTETGYALCEMNSCPNPTVFTKLEDWNGRNLAKEFMDMVETLPLTK